MCPWTGIPARTIASGAADLVAAADSPRDDVYYRYVDPDGTVFITRVRPSTYPYEVLDP